MRRVDRNVSLERAEPMENVLNPSPSFLESDKTHYINTDGLPWIEIDFSNDLKRAWKEIYPRMVEDGI